MKHINLKTSPRPKSIVKDCCKNDKFVYCRFLSNKVTCNDPGINLYYYNFSIALN